MEDFLFPFPDFILYNLGVSCVFLMDMWNFVIDIIDAHASNLDPTFNFDELNWGFNIISKNNYDTVTGYTVS